MQNFFVVLFVFAWGFLIWGLFEMIRAWKVAAKPYDNGVCEWCKGTGYIRQQGFSTEDIGPKNLALFKCPKCRED